MEYETLEERIDRLQRRTVSIMERERMIREATVRVRFLALHGPRALMLEAVDWYSKELGLDSDAFLYESTT